MIPEYLFCLSAEDPSRKNRICVQNHINFKSDTIITSLNLREQYKILDQLADCGNDWLPCCCCLVTA